MKIVSKLLFFASACVLLSLGACKKSYLDRLPTTEKPLDDVFKTTEGCQQALEGIHSLMYQSSGPENFGQKSIDLINDVMGEDMIFSGFGAGWFTQYANYQDPHNAEPYIWNYYYTMINNCNAILDHIDGATGPESEKDNIKGQVYFYLAFAYYNLSLYYQHTYAANPNALGVPIYHHVTKVGNPRATLRDLYSEIQSDLRKAEQLLNPAQGGTATDGDISEIHLAAAYGLHARVALVMQNWALADSMAGAARAGHPYMSATDLLSGFNSSNTSWIWGSSLTVEQTGARNSFLGHMDINAGGYAALGSQKEILKFLYTLIPDGSNPSKGLDVRRGWWFSKDTADYLQYSQRKFRQKAKWSFALDVCYMRAAEMGLIQAEAEAQQNDLASAQATLNELMRIRNPQYDASKFTTKDALIIEILYQRRVELWGEGFRYSDIQRCAAIPAASGSNMPGYLSYQGLNRPGRTLNPNGDYTIWGDAMSYTVSDFNFLFRIPINEMNYNPNMVQNTP